MIRKEILFCSQIWFQICCLVLLARRFQIVSERQSFLLEGQHSLVHVQEVHGLDDAPLGLLLFLPCQSRGHLEGFLHLRRRFAHLWGLSIDSDEARLAVFELLRGSRLALLGTSRGCLFVTGLSHAVICLSGHCLSEFRPSCSVLGHRR